MSSPARPSPNTEVESSPKRQKTDSNISVGASEPVYTLHNYWRSSCSWRVRIALAHKKIPYTYLPVNLLKSEQSSAAYAAKNPQKKVPLLSWSEKDEKGETVERNLFQSLAIIDYLETKHPQHPLLPKDPFLRAKALSLAEGINADIQPLQNLYVINRVSAIAGEQAKSEWLQWIIPMGLRAFEDALEGFSGKYCIGDEVTLPDAFLIPQLYSARRFNIDLTQYPKLLEIEKNLIELPAFKEADANNQPDNPTKA
jgi:maleylacetoacetate isomerase